MHSDEEFSSKLAGLRSRIDARLDALTATALETSAAAEAARYALLAPGKRLRPLIAVLAAEQFGGSVEPAIDFGCAVEMTHAASLVLDDLPCMDDAAMRRGRQAVHLRYGEDAAVLAAVALLNQSFTTVIDAAGVSAVQRVEAVGALSAAVGFGGLVSGQIRDLRDDPSKRSAANLTDINHAKTGALFMAAAELGAIAADADPSHRSAGREFGRRLGQAFQIRDDLADSRSEGFSDPSKDAGKDLGKQTLVSLVGSERARVAMRAELEAALLALPGAGPLGDLARAMFERQASAA